MTGPQFYENHSLILLCQAISILCHRINEQRINCECKTFYRLTFLRETTVSSESTVNEVSTLTFLPVNAFSSPQKVKVRTSSDSPNEQAPKPPMIFIKITIAFLLLSVQVSRSQTPTTSTATAPTPSASSATSPTPATPTGDDSCGEPTSVDVGYYLHIKYDQYPEETRVVVRDHETLEILVDTQAFATPDPLTAKRFSLALVPGREYRVIMLDTQGNGICCQYGSGWIQVYARVDGSKVQLMPAVREYGSRKGFRFTVPSNIGGTSSCGNTSPTPATSSATSPTPASSSATSTIPATSSATSTTSASSSATASTSSASSSTPATPTGDDSCGEPTSVDVGYYLHIKYDQYPEETRVVVRDHETLEILVDTQTFDTPAPLTGKRFPLQLVPGREYRVIMLDTEGDGICCQYGSGWIQMYAWVDEKTKVQLMPAVREYGSRKVFRFTVPEDICKY